jgi:lipid-A-disaccharide synthase-like uncharacterized protein
MASFTWLLGGLGMVAVEGSYAPQLLRLYKLKRADEISYFFPGLNFCGRLLALAYSVLRSDQVFTVGFILGCALRLALLCQVYWYRHGGRRPDAPAAEPAPGASEMPPLATGVVR